MEEQVGDETYAGEDRIWSRSAGSPTWKGLNKNLIWMHMCVDIYISLQGLLLGASPVGAGVGRR
jgi:hypothetical protein